MLTRTASELTPEVSPGDRRGDECRQVFILRQRSTIVKAGD